MLCALFLHKGSVLAMLDISFFKHMSEKKILVVGDVMLDRYWLGDSQRISPEAPVPVVNIAESEDKVGGAANVARNIAHLDGQVALMGIIGNDDNADILESILVNENIESALFRQDDHPTITKLRVISRQQQVVRLDFEEYFSEQHSKSLLALFKQRVNDFDFIVFSDYNKGSLAQVSEMIKVARAANKTVLIDPKTDDLGRYCGANIITPNLKEFMHAGGQVGSEEIIAQSARKLMSDAGIESILLTRSEQGMSMITQDDKHDFPAQVLEVADVTGAGDTVIATLAIMLAAGASKAQAAQIANLAASVVVAKLGAATVSPEELYQLANRELFGSQKSHYQTPVDDALQHIRFASLAGEKIVFTNGCFDILHAGHVHYLEQAKALGDRLVLGLNSDESVRRLKGETRPVNSFEDRATVLTGLASVDWVIPFGEINNDQYDDTPYHLIDQVRPDVLVKGGDYSIEQIVGADLVQERGGEVAIIEFLDGRSTTRIIEKIQDQDAK